jgi:hypothetical protein
MISQYSNFRLWNWPGQGALVCIYFESCSFVGEYAGYAGRGIAGHRLILSLVGPPREALNTYCRDYWQLGFGACRRFAQFVGPERTESLLHCYRESRSQGCRVGLCPSNSLRLSSFAGRK